VSARIPSKMAKPNLLAKNQGVLLGTAAFMGKKKTELRVSAQLVAWQDNFNG
jgi:hypothetical protein